MSTSSAVAGWRHRGPGVLAALTIVLALALVGAAQRRDSPDALLGAGLHQEEVEGDCREAIRIYERVTTQRDASRNTAARAWLGIGRCRERLGAIAARDAYEQVLTQYPEEIDVVMRAQMRVATLTSSTGQEVTYSGLQKVMSDWVGGGGAVSPDGRYVFSPHPGTRLFDFARRSEVYLNSPGPMIGVPAGAFSADGRRFAYALVDAEAPASSVAELRTVELPATWEPGQLVLRSQEFVRIVPFGWSPDGNVIYALMTRTDDTSVIAAISANGSMRIVHALDWRRPTGLSVSPDGRYIAYDAPAERGSTNHGIFLLPSRGGAVVPLVVNAAHDSMALWTPDSKAIVFRSNRSGTAGLWAVEVADGQARGAARLLRRDVGQLRPIGFARNGSLYYQVPAANAGQPSAVDEFEGPAGAPSRQTSREVWVDPEFLPNHRRQSLFVADIHPTTGQLRTAPVPLSESLLVIDSRPRWSPDGTAITFERWGTSADGGPIRQTLVRTIATGEERSFDAIFAGAWFNDSRGLLYRRGASGPRQPVARLRLDIETGTSSEVVVAPRGPDALSPDDAILYVVSNPLAVVDIASGREIRRIPLPATIFGGTVSYESVTLSPDQRTLAVWTDHGLFRIGVDGSGYRELYPADPPDWGTRPVWTRDGRGILIAVRDDHQIWRVLRVPADGGRPAFTGLEVRGYQDFNFGFDLSPDRDQLVFDGIAPRIIADTRR